jgi:hypothetical protein
MSRNRRHNSESVHLRREEEKSRPALLLVVRLGTVAVLGRVPELL